jgi:hypothetical protein
MEQLLIQFIATPREGPANCWESIRCFINTINNLAIHSSITNNQSTMSREKVLTRSTQMMAI